MQYRAGSDKWMLTRERQARLMALLAAEGRIVAQDAAQALGLSEDTIRRDLRHLAAEGRLMRVHGGALPLSPTHLPLAQRTDLRGAEKARLARAAVALLQPGQVVIVDGGTTHAAVVQALPRDWSGTIVTHSPTIAAALELHSAAEVILIGGRLYRHSMVAVGAVAQAGFARVKADLALIGVTGLHPDLGLTTGDAEEAAIKAAMIDAAAEVAVLATADKLATARPWRIAGLDRLTILLTDGQRPAWLPPSTGHLSASD
jgi:DeoR/GlpR family transcriptional regulator of sugar metabolism